TASAASAMTTARFIPAWGHGLLAVWVGHAFSENATSRRAARAASRTSAATAVRCRPVTGSPNGVWADLAEWTEATAIGRGRGLEAPGADAFGHRNDLCL